MVVSWCFMIYWKLQHVSKHDLLRLNYEALKHVNSRWGRSRKINPRWSISHSRYGQWNMKMQGPHSPGEVLREHGAANGSDYGLQRRWGHSPSLDCFMSVDKASEGNQTASVAHRQTAPPNTHINTQTLITFAFGRADLAVSDRLEHCYSWLQMSRTLLCPSLISANIVTNFFKGQTRLLNLLIHA